MLLFKPKHISLIQKGWKNVSRRMWDKPRANVGSYHQIKTKIFTKDHHGYIQIKRLYRERLLTITEDHAQREGGYTREQYIALFHDIYPCAGNNPMLWVVEFEYVGMVKP